MYRHKPTKQIINVNRDFNYNDVMALVHEFIHYTNGKKFSKSRKYLTEFLSIYFDFFTIDYLLEKGINKEEIDYLRRIKIAKMHSSMFYTNEKVLLAFDKFGNLDENTVPLLRQYLVKISKQTFERKCTILYNNLCVAEEKHKEEIKENPKISGRVLSEEFIIKNYLYILGTFLAIYAYKYVNIDTIIYLNNHIADYDGISVYDICLNIGIDIEDEDFSEKLFQTLNEYIEKFSCNTKKIS